MSNRSKGPCAWPAGRCNVGRNPFDFAQEVLYAAVDCDFIFQPAMNPETENPLASPMVQDTHSSHALESLDAATLTPDLTLAHLADRNLSGEIVEQISRNIAAMNSRKVRFAVAAHPGTPRRIALRLIRELYTFDLMRFSLLPAATADLKRMADDLLVARLASISLGERTSLARRSSGKVAAALLLIGNRVFGRLLWKILGSRKPPLSRHCCALALCRLLSKPSATIPNGRRARKFVWLCYATSTRPWLAP